MRLLMWCQGVPYMASYESARQSWTCMFHRMVPRAAPIDRQTNRLAHSGVCTTSSVSPVALTN